MKKKILISIGIILCFCIYFLQPSVLFFKQNEVQTYKDIVYGDYNHIKDKEKIIQIYRDNLYWLSANPKYDIESVLERRTPRPERKDSDQTLFIKTIKYHGDLVGFITFHKKDQNNAAIHLVAVAKVNRNKGYGKFLITQTIEEMKKLGSQKIYLTTRTDNIPAQRMYEKIGFAETDRDLTFVHYALSI